MTQPEILTESGKRMPLRRLTAVNPVIYAFLVMLIVDLLLQPAIFSVSEFGDQIASALPLMFVAFAQTLVVLTGGFDLSVGGILVITNVLTATWLSSGTHRLGLLIVIVCIGMILGAVNGVLIAYVRFESFIATLGTWAIYDGIALTILPTDGGTVPAALTNFVNGSIGPVPTAYLIFAVLILVALYIHRHAYGTYLKATGADAESARRNGIKISQVRLGAYILSGFFCALAGIYLAAQTGTGTPTAGDGYILQSIEAVAIGGASFLGGEGNLLASIAAVFVLTFISNIVFALNLQPYVAVIASSVLLLAAVLVKSTRQLFGGRQG
ncbi:MAG: ABC transporter permease [Firmicutes bacterium]|nr:ABC transporter permease [Bacillota bacterium]